MRQIAYNVPPYNEPFIGQIPSLDKLEELVSHRASKVFITGPPGIGKTSLVQQFIRLSSDQRCFSWLEATSKETFFQQINTFLSFLQIPHPPVVKDKTQEKETRRAKDALNRICLELRKAKYHGSNHLIFIIDSCFDPVFLLECISPFASFIITTRQFPQGVLDKEIINLSGISSAYFPSFFQAFSPSTCGEETFLEAGEYLQGHPILMKEAISYLSSHPEASLRKDPLTFLASLSEPFASYQSSLQKLKSGHARFFSLLSCLGFTKIPHPIAMILYHNLSWKENQEIQHETMAIDRIEYAEYLAELADASLIRYERDYVHNLAPYPFISLLQVGRQDLLLVRKVLLLLAEQHAPLEEGSQLTQLVFHVSQPFLADMEDRHWNVWREKISSLEQAACVLVSSEGEESFEDLMSDDDFVKIY